jgi:uncharacterized membrane protein YeaQ/YmgE (transglycosylase-associated protein family)
MSFLAWIVLGLIAGFSGGKIVDSRGGGMLRDVLLGVVGAFAVAGCSISLEPPA